MAGFVPHKKQADLLRAFLIDENKLGVALFGRQTGKTISAVQLAKFAAIMKQGTYFMVFRTYNQADQVVWKQYIHTIEPELIQGSEKNKVGLNKNDLSVTFNYLDATLKLPGVGEIHVKHDTNLPPSRIRLLGSDQAESHRGNKANGIIFDEYQSQNPDNWTNVYQPMFTTTDGWALFMGTPNGFNHFYDLVQEAKSHPEDYYFTQATWRDNPYASEKAVGQARKDATRKGNLNGFLQEYELEFRKVDRAVYTEFDRDVHVIPPSEVPTEGGQIWASIDFGYVEDHPTAVNFVRIMEDGTWYVYDEMHVTETPLDNIIEQIKQRTSGIHLQGIVGDSARPDLIDYMGSKALPIIPAAKRPGSVQTAITLMKQMLHPRLQLLGEPKPMLYVASNCRNTILNFELRRYKEPVKERAINEVPVKENDDHTDELGYLLTHLKYGIKKDTGDWGNKNIKFDSFGMPVST